MKPDEKYVQRQFPSFTKFLTLTEFSVKQLHFKSFLLFQHKLLSCMSCYVPERWYEEKKKKPCSVSEQGVTVGGDSKCDLSRSRKLRDRNG